MLQKKAVPRAAMDVLNFLSTQYFLNDFRLVGGTALALYWGHRTSVDIDLFTDKKLSLLEIEQKLSLLEDSSQITKNPIGLTYMIKKVKCDFVTYPYRFIFDKIEEEGIRIAHIEDVIALKLGAIANRGVKKDFIDLYYILEKYSLNEVLHFYERIYKVKEHFSLLKSMTYFEDAENEITPKLLLNKDLSWKKIKKAIVQKVSKTL
jgi:predicted nucleotidyltransferase component of viral defense system